MDNDSVKMKKEYPIKRFTRSTGYEDLKDWVAEEKEVTVFLNGKKAAVLLCSPVHLDELAVGHLFASGRIKREDLVQVLVQEGKYSINVITGSKTLESAGTSAKEKAVESAGQNREKGVDEFLDIINELSGKSEIFRETGGAHTAALLLPLGLIFREDVGRHNAVDKLLGYCAMNKIYDEDAALLLSGRVSGEIVTKANMLGVSTIVSRSAPTSLAVEKAQEFGMTLVGFARGDRANIYTHF